MSVSKECIASQWLISIKDSNLLVFPYTIEIIFETPGHEGNLKQLILSKNKNNEFKQFCRAALNMIDIFHGVSYAYDGRTKLWSPTEIIADEMNFEWIQPNLPPFLQQRFQNPDGILKVKIQPGNDILLSDFPKSVNGLIEDRTWRNIIEVVLSEHAITRVHDRYIMLKSGKMFEIEGHPFERGLVWREGNKKGAHIIKEKEQAQMCFAMDYQKLVFFPNYANFLEFLRAFMRNNMVNFVEAEQLCHGLLLQPANNPRRMLRFKQFTNVNRHGNNMPKAVMFQIEETFELHELIIKADQKVNVDFLEDTLKEKVLKLNLFPAFQRIELINQQFRRLELDNPCTQAFGIFVYQEMLRGSAEILPPMITVGANNFQLTPFENGSFQLKPQNYFKKAKIDQVIVLASRRDFEKSLNDIQKVMKHLSPNYKQLIEFQEFNLFSQSDEQWLDVFDRIEADYGIERTLILAIDGPRVSHYFLKYSEAFTGIHTQHIMASTIVNADTRTQHNICHKINVKMGGLNLIVKFGPFVLNLDLNSNKVIVISIDVCHATGADYKGETTEPSTIGISINNGKHPQEIYDSFFYGETREEIVEQNSLARYIEIQLKEALKYRNEIEKIIVIRDGVDEGRFSKVVEEEVKAIKSATKNLGINAAKFVVFLVNKKTNARHFKNDESNITSMAPRSFVSFGTRYKFKQFFMTPHRSITGTAVSPLVTILLDEIGITKAEAQEFLLGLTYLHQIVNSPISIPAPMNQADETSFRGQYLYRHITRNGDETRSNDELTRLLNFGDALAPRTRYNA